MNLESLINSLNKKIDLLSQVDLAIINQIGGSNNDEKCDEYDNLANDFETAINKNIQIYEQMEKKIIDLQNQLNNNDLQNRNNELEKEIAELKSKLNDDTNLKRIKELEDEIKNLKQKNINLTEKSSNNIVNSNRLKDLLKKCGECKNKYKTALDNINSKLSNLTEHNNKINK